MSTLMLAVAVIVLLGIIHLFYSMLREDVEHLERRVSRLEIKKGVDPSLLGHIPILQSRVDIMDRYVAGLSERFAEVMDAKEDTKPNKRKAKPKKTNSKEL